MWPNLLENADEAGCCYTNGELKVGVAVSLLYCLNLFNVFVSTQHQTKIIFLFYVIVTQFLQAKYLGDVEWLLTS